MQTSTKWYSLGAVLLIFAAIMVPRTLHFRGYSDLEAYEICLAVHMQCKQLKAQKATNAEWETFQHEALPKLREITKDIEDFTRGRTRGRPGGHTAGSVAIYQLANDHLPQQIQAKSDGSVPKSAIAKKGDDRRYDMDRKLAETLSIINTSKETPAQRNEMWRAKQNRNAWDPLIVGIVCVDVLALAGGLGYWFWPKQ